MGFVEDVGRLLYSAGVEMSPRRFISFTLVYALGFGLAALLVFMRVSTSLAVAAFAVTYISVLFTVYVLVLLTANRRLALVEDALPDFLTLMASNIRSGLVPDKALVSSARREFGPLTNEINRAVKLSMAGRSFAEAFETVGANVASATLAKSVRLVVEGTRAGGNLAELLDNTASDVRRFNALKNEVRSNVMIYRFFLFTAAALGAPFLFATANFVITMVFRIKGIAGIEASAIPPGLGLPMSQSVSALSPDLTFYFSIAALFLTALFSSLAGGLISTGRASEDVKYFPAILVVSLAVFMGTKLILESVFSMLFFV